MERRSYLSALAGLAPLAALAGPVRGDRRPVDHDAVGEDGPPLALAATDGTHPGPPRFLSTAQALVDPLQDEPTDRDNLAPSIPSPTRDPTGPAEGTYDWRIANAPAASDATLQGDGDGVVEFDPDVAGTYALEVTTPETTHTQTLRVFEASTTDAGPPRVSLEGAYDADAGTFSLSASPHTAPDSDLPDGSLSVAFQPDDRDALTAADLSVEGTTATVPEGAVADGSGGTARVHAVAHGADGVSVADAVVLDAGAGTVTGVNDGPEWIDDATVYEIFVRAFAGTEQARTDFAFLESKVDYLAGLGVDAVWLTPILEAHTTYDSGGDGVHGYDVLDYFEPAADLRRNGSFQSFVDACHANGIKVIFDLVANHTARGHPFFQDTVTTGRSSPYYDWYDRGADGEAEYFFEWFGIPNLDYGTPAVREHMLSVVDYWADVVDGFRCDVAWGVPHSFWKEVRRRVKTDHPDVVLLEEAIPYDPSFDEAEFDLHFDADLFGTLRAVGTGAAEAASLYDAVAARAEAGFRDGSQFLQYVENHDESRYLDEADRAAQKAAAAATFTLPGTPMVYYGQERGVGRDPAVADERRADMPWSGHDADLLAYYRRLIELRDSDPTLQSAAAFVDVGYEVPGSGGADEVVAFGRRTEAAASVVVVNFGAAPARVRLSGTVGTRDAFTGRDVAASGGGTGAGDGDGGTVVEVDTLAVLPATDLDGRGRPVARWSDPTGDDDGPGTYTYPTGEDFPPGVFDLESVAIYETTETYQFEATIAGGLSNPFDLAEGFSHPFFQVYVHDPAAEGGSTATRPGVNATLADTHHYRLLIDGERGARLTDDGGSPLPGGEASLHVDPTRNAIRADVPKRVFESEVGELAVAPLLCGYDGFGTGQVRPVEATADEFTFGGGRDDDLGANVIDLLAPAATSQAEALAVDPEASGPSATVPFVPVRAGVGRVALDGQRVARWTDPAGDDDGPGAYTYPTSDDFSPGAFDLTSVELRATGDQFRIVYTLAGELRNPFGLPGGFSHPFVQLYVRDPTAPGGSRAAREGVGVEFDAPHHYRLLANGEQGAWIERADGSTLTDDVSVRPVEALDAVVVEVPRSALDLRGMAVAPLLCPYDGYGTGGVRAVNATSGAYAFGGGTDGDADPAVIDMIAPAGTTQAEALSDGPDDPASVPYVTVPDPDVLPRDVDGDGRFEDVDGDGRSTYDDVVELFEHADDRTVRGRPAAFDFNDNGRFDFDDIVDLFENLSG
jgi:glycosidase/carbohydrate-binding DOMON domain-containing protein